MPMLCMSVLIVAMRMTVSFFFTLTMRVAITVIVLMEQKQSYDIEKQSDSSNNQNQLRVFDFLNLEESLYSIQNDGCTECDQEDTIDKTSEDFCSSPLSQVVSCLLQLPHLINIHHKYSRLNCSCFLPHRLPSIQQIAI